MRERDLALTHTLINPQINRAVSAAKQADPFLAARVREFLRSSVEASY